MFKKNPSIEYWTTVQGLETVNEIKPQSLKNYIPEWWKSIPSGGRTARNCPSFTDVFSSAYVLPMWCDTKIIRDNNTVRWETPFSIYEWHYHSNDQFLDYSPTFLKEKVWAVMKPISPWHARTTKGYSIYQMPVFYDFNEDFSAIPGIIHTDVYHELNPQILMYSDKKEFMIKRGTPLAIHFPFKRSKVSLSTRYMNKEDEKNMMDAAAMVRTKFLGGYRMKTKGFMQ
jgi:hypothetical protein